MIDLLILYLLSKKVFTMYGIWKTISKEFSMFTLPSYGTIGPALKRLEADELVKSQRTMSSGGKRSTYYSLTDRGLEGLKFNLLSQIPDNPTYFLTSARVRLSCAGVLETSEQLELFKALKLKAENIMLESRNLLESGNLDFYSKVVQDNLVCEYKNFISLLEGVERACKN